MASQVTKSLVVAATATAPTKTVAQLITQADINVKDEGLATPSDGESGDSSGTTYYHQHIERNGERVLVSWTKEEERRVVRKADYLFLPIFAVCISAFYYKSGGYNYQYLTGAAAADVHMDGN